MSTVITQETKDKIITLLEMTMKVLNITEVLYKKYFGKCVNYMALKEDITEIYCLLWIANDYAEIAEPIAKTVIDTLCRIEAKEGLCDD